MILNIEISKSKKVCLWESGGGAKTTGWSQIICDANGLPKQPIYVKERGERANGDHALIPININDVVVAADHHNNDFQLFIYKIDGYIYNKESHIVDKVSIRTIATFGQGEWDLPSIAGMYQDAIKAATEKAVCFHCREPHFIFTQGFENKIPTEEIVGALND